MERKTIIFKKTYNLAALGVANDDFEARAAGFLRMYVRRISWNITTITPLTLKTNPYSDGLMLTAGLRCPSSPNVVDINGGATNEGHFAIDFTRQHCGQMNFEYYPVDSGRFTFDAANIDAAVAIQFTIFIMIELYYL